MLNSREERITVRELVGLNPSVKYQVGFHIFLFSRKQVSRSRKLGKLGKPGPFSDLKHHHSDLPKRNYGDKRVLRLATAPDGGAMADLVSHAISFLFLSLDQG